MFRPPRGVLPGSPSEGTDARHPALRSRSDRSRQGWRDLALQVAQRERTLTLGRAWSVGLTAAPGNEAESSGAWIAEGRRGALFEAVRRRAGFAWSTQVSEAAFEDRDMVEEEGTGARKQTPGRGNEWKALLESPTTQARGEKGRGAGRGPRWRGAGRCKTPGAWLCNGQR